MIKKALIILFLLLFAVSSVFAATVKKKKLPYFSKTIEIETSDHYIIKSKLMYPRAKGLYYPTVILLHSLGASGSSWGTLPVDIVKQGYAVLVVDFRGHGISNKDSNYRTTSWTNFSTKTYSKFPNDLIAIIEKAKRTTKKASFDNYSIIGSDIGANTGVITASKNQIKPKALVLLNPYLSIKGLTIFDHVGDNPISKIDNTPILVMCSRSDVSAVRQEIILKSFVSGEYIINNTDAQASGMLILKLDKACNDKAVEFINNKMPPKDMTPKVMLDKDGKPIKPTTKPATK